MRARRRVLHCVAAGMLSWVPRAFGQSPRIHRIGCLSTCATHGPLDDAFLQGLREHGYTVGRDLVIEYRWAGNDFSRLQPRADELVRLNVDVLVRATTAGTRAAMRATRTIPIVMAAAADPVSAGLVTSLGRPGGNVTGGSLQTTDVASKRLHLAGELVPGATRIGLLVELVAEPSQRTTLQLVAEATAAAARMGVRVVVQEITVAGELDNAFAGLKCASAEVLIVQVSPLTLEHRIRVAELAARGRRRPVTACRRAAACRRARGAKKNGRRLRRPSTRPEALFSRAVP